MRTARRPSPSPLAARAAIAAATLGALVAAASPASAITRCEVLADAESWVAAGVPYSQGPWGSYCPSDYCYADPLRPAVSCWRSDCSGFVSAAWNVTTSDTYSGRSTLGYAPFDDAVSYVLPSYDDLLPGDALNNDGHIMLFGGWTGEGTFFVYEESTCEPQYGSTTAHRSDYAVGDAYIQTFDPIRFVGIEPCEQAPVGAVDEATCEVVRGWSHDPDTPAAAVDVHVYFDAPPGEPGAVARPAQASLPRPDLCDAIGSCDHGFELRPPRALRDEQPHAVWAYGLDTGGGDPALLAGTPATIQCPRATPPADAAHARKRWITAPAVFDAWRFAADDVAPLLDASPWADGPLFPGGPVVVRADDGSPDVWVIDGEERRHVASPASLAAWKLDASVATLPAAVVLAQPRGADWFPEPFLFRGAGPEVYVLDWAPANPGAGGGGGGAGGGSAWQPPGAGGSPPSGTPTATDAAGDAGGSADGGCAHRALVAGAPRGGSLGVAALTLIALAASRRRGARAVRAPRTP